MVKREVFALGDRVEWMTPGVKWEQCSMYPHYYHQGVVSLVIAAGQRYTNDAYGPRSRDHESYEVTEQNGNRKPKAYWPIVSLLRKVQE